MFLSFHGSLPVIFNFIDMHTTDLLAYTLELCKRVET